MEPGRVVRPKPDLSTQDGLASAPGDKSNQDDVSNSPVGDTGPWRASLRGVTRGIVKANRHHTQAGSPACWVIMESDRLDLLLAAMTAPSLHLERVYTRGQPHPLVTELAKRGSFYLSTWEKLPQAPLGPEVVCLFNCRIAQSMFRTLADKEVSLVISTLGARKLPKGWHCFPLKLAHSAVGGVTSTTSVLVGFQRGGGLWNSCPLPTPGM